MISSHEFILYPGLVPRDKGKGQKVFGVLAKYFTSEITIDPKSYKTEKCCNSAKSFHDFSWFFL